MNIYTAIRSYIPHMLYKMVMKDCILSRMDMKDCMGMLFSSLHGGSHVHSNHHNTHNLHWSAHTQAAVLSIGVSCKQDCTAICLNVNKEKMLVNIILKFYQQKKKKQNNFLFRT